MRKLTSSFNRIKMRDRNARRQYFYSKVTSVTKSMKMRSRRRKLMIQMKKAKISKLIQIKAPQKHS